VPATTAPAPATPQAAPPAAQPSAPPVTTPGVEAPAAPKAPVDELPPRLRFPGPAALPHSDVDSEVFKPRVINPPSEPGGSPTVNIDAAGRRARELVAEESRSRRVVNVLPPPPRDYRSKLAEDMEKSFKPDCRTAYAGLGFLAVIPLVAATVGDGGCVW